MPGTYSPATHGLFRPLALTPHSAGDRGKYEIWMAAFGATLVVCAAPVFILPFIPLGDYPHENER